MSVTTPTTGPTTTHRAWRFIPTTELVASMCAPAAVASHLAWAQMEGRFAMANNRRSAIVDLLASKGKPMSTKAIAEALGVDAGVMGTRVRQLEESGKLAPVGTATRTRDVRWIPADPDVIGRRPKIAISYRAAENIEAMRAAALERMLEGKPANWVQEPDEVTA